MVQKPYSFISFKWFIDIFDYKILSGKFFVSIAEAGETKMQYQKVINKN